MNAIKEMQYMARSERADLLFEVSPIFLVNKYKVQVVANRKFLVDVSHRRCQVIAIEKQADWYRLT